MTRLDKEKPTMEQVKVLRLFTGFSLLELIITMALITILAAIAAPSYQETTRQARLHWVQSELHKFHLQQQNFLLENHRYADETELALPNSNHYNFELKQQGSSGFLIAATAHGGQQNGSQCDELTLDESLTRLPAKCWE